jgi:hypothetical protein
MGAQAAAWAARLGRCEYMRLLAAPRGEIPHERAALLSGKLIEAYPGTISLHFDAQDWVDLPKRAPVLVQVIPMLGVEHQPAADPDRGIRIDPGA